LNRWVVDASLALKWYLDEPASDDARRLLADDADLHVPDLFHAEVASVLVKRRRRGELDHEALAAVRTALDLVPLTVHASRPILDAAIDRSLALHISVYDAVYVALAMGLGFDLATADRRLVHACAGRAGTARVVHAEDTEAGTR
jgi:predicted nucleic acid-binding protein